MDTTQPLKRQRAAILEVARRHGVRSIRVFGSTARGEDGPDSDVDLLVEAGSNRSPFFPGGLIADLEELLGRKVHVVTKDALHWYIRDRVVDESVPL